MAIRTELSLRLPNTPGALSKVCNALQDARVNILALHLESSGRLRLLVQIQKLSALKEQGLLTEEEFAAKKAQILGL